MIDWGYLRLSQALLTDMEEWSVSLWTWVPFSAINVRTALRPPASYTDPDSLVTINSNTCIKYTAMHNDRLFKNLKRVWHCEPSFYNMCQLENWYPLLQQASRHEHVAQLAQCLHWLCEVQHTLYHDSFIDNVYVHKSTYQHNRATLKPSWISLNTEGKKNTTKVSHHHWPTPHFMFSKVHQISAAPYTIHNKLIVLWRLSFHTRWDGWEWLIMAYIDLYSLINLVGLSMMSVWKSHYTTR